MPYDAPDLSALSLDAIAQLVAERKLPPVNDWNPSHCGDSRMRITLDGRWYHDGGEIKRPAMVRAFASLLRREADGSYVLVTPAGKLSILVEDAPFLAVEMAAEGTGRDTRIAFRLNTDDLVLAGPDHALRFAGDIPYLTVRNGLEAKLSRAVAYELAERALAEGADPPAVWSDGACFALASA